MTPQAQATPQPGTPQAGTPQADPRLQRIGMAVQKLVYEPNTAKRLVDIIKQAGDPAQGIAAAAAIILQKIMQSTKGMDPKQLSVIAGMASVMHVAVLANAAGVVKFDRTVIQNAIKALAQIAAGAQQNAPQNAQPVPPQGQGLVGQTMQGGA